MIIKNRITLSRRYTCSLNISYKLALKLFYQKTDFPHLKSPEKHLHSPSLKMFNKSYSHWWHQNFIMQPSSRKLPHGPGIKHKIDVAWQSEINDLSILNGYFSSIPADYVFSGRTSYYQSNHLWFITRRAHVTSPGIVQATRLLHDLLAAPSTK